MVFGSARRAVIDHAPDLPAVVAGVLRRAPDAGDAEFSATASLIVVGAIHLSPCVGTSSLDSPTLPLGMLQGVLDFRLGMRLSGHLVVLPRLGNGKIAVK
jgi:hypothetical protein